MHLVKRCKYKEGHETFDRCHGASAFTTLCGKETDAMWWAFEDDNPEKKINCPHCLRVLRATDTE